MPLTIVKQSLFDAPKGSTIIHAVNAQGVWGSGIAKEFKIRYPIDFAIYKKFVARKYSTGDGYISFKNSFTDENPHMVGCLVTSENYGPLKDSREVIKINTTIALQDVLEDATYYGITEIYSNKFNSGLFDVPWEESRLILEILLKRYPEINWTVCEQ